ncbi:hypothetical protein J6590_006450 [Homalodisca vitripennis]|nr:hypothetical protein J6590_006450 [Homalodisca vitripennis]
MNRRRIVSGVRRDDRLLVQIILLQKQTTHPSCRDLSDRQSLALDVRNVVHGCTTTCKHMTVHTPRSRIPRT